jgi:hypothetical protein
VVLVPVGGGDLKRPVCRADFSEVTRLPSAAPRGQRWWHAWGRVERHRVPLLVVLALAVAIGAVPSSTAKFTGVTSGPSNSWVTATMPNPTGFAASRPCPATTTAPTLRDTVLATAGTTGATATGVTSEPGDIIVAIATVNGTMSNTLASPADGTWTNLGYDDSGYYNRTGVFWRRAPTTAGSYNYAFTWGADAGALTVLSYSGADGTTPVVTSVKTSGDSYYPTVPVVNVTRAYSRAITAISIDDTGTMPAPTGMTERSTQRTGGTGSIRVNVWDEARTSTGNTPSRTVDPSAFGSVKWVSWTVLLQPPAKDPKVTLSWTAPANTIVTGYTITRTGGTGATFTVSGRTTVTYVDATYTPSVGHTYAIKSTAASSWVSTGASASVVACV